jgi:hypothetical protein
MSGGERKRNEAHVNVMTKMLNVNSPNYYYDNRQNNYGSGLVPQQNYLSELMHAVPAYQIAGGSPIMKTGVKLPIHNRDISTPLKKRRRSDDGAELEAGP